MFVYNRLSNSTDRHLATEALSGDVRRVEGLDLGVVEQQPAVVVLVLAVADERVVVAAIGRTRVDCHTYELVPDKCLSITSILFLFNNYLNYS